MIEPESRMHKIKYATLCKRKKYIYQKKKKNSMKNFMSFDAWIKIMGTLLAILLAIYATVIIFEYYWPKENLEFELIIPDEKLEKEGTYQVIKLEDISEEELEEVGLIEPTKEEKKYLYSEEPPIRTKVAM